MTAAKVRRVPDQRVATDIAVSYVQVNRLRTGNRLPSIETMQQIEDVFDWSVQRQSDARRGGIWAAQFEAAIVRRYGGVR